MRTREKHFDPAVLPLTRKLFHAFGHWVTCSDDHMGEYVAYGWEAGEDGYDFAADDRNRLWKLDFEVPKKYGIRHTLGENGGPGGLFFTCLLYTSPSPRD